jgi:hypothetical protein
MAGDQGRHAAARLAKALTDLAEKSLEKLIGIALSRSSCRWHQRLGAKQRDARDGASAMSVSLI